MNMNKKSLIYLIMGILGIGLIVLAIVLAGRVPNTVDGALMGIGAGLIGLGISGWYFCHWIRREPEKWRQYEIEAGDERNAAIRHRAKAAAGDVLQWIVIAAAWAAIFLGAPVWVILAAVGIFLFKIILEICLMSRYQKRM